MSIKDAIHNLMDNKLDAMKENFNSVLTSKAIEKLDEKKIQIAQNYFGQDKTGK